MITRPHRPAVIALALVALVAAPASAQDRDVRIRVPMSIVIDDITDAIEESLSALQGLDHRHMAGLDRLRDLRLDLGLDLRLGLDRSLRGVDLQDRNFRAEQVARETRTFALGASGRLELGNIVGDITVTGGSGTSATVEIVKTARGRTDEDARRGLEAVQVEVEEERGAARLRTEYPQTRGRQTYSVSVAYVVRAPAGTRVSATSVSGDITVNGITATVTTDVISGDTEISGGRDAVTAKAVSGDVTVADAQSSEAVDITSINGNVSLRGVRASRLRVSGVSGDVTASDVDVDTADIKSMAGDVHFSGALSRGGRYTFQAHSGDVELTLGGAGFDLEAGTFSGSIQPASGMTLTDATASRRSLRGRVAGGGASVEATTFSGDVRITRR